MKQLLLTLTLFACFQAVMSQVGVAISNTSVSPDPSAMLDIESSSQGLLVPRLPLTATNIAAPVNTPANSLLIYNTTTSGTTPNNVTPGYYYWDISTSAWIRLVSGNIVGTDNQNLDSLMLSGTTLTAYIENGSSATTDISGILDSIRTIDSIFTPDYVIFSDSNGRLSEDTTLHFKTVINNRGHRALLLNTDSIISNAANSSFTLLQAYYDHGVGNYKSVNSLEDGYIGLNMMGGNDAPTLNFKRGGGNFSTMQPLDTSATNGSKTIGTILFTGKDSVNTTSVTQAFIQGTARSYHNQRLLTGFQFSGRTKTTPTNPIFFYGYDFINYHNNSELLLELNNDGEGGIKANFYKDSRNDSTPMNNIIYTDNNGLLQSKSIDSLINLMRDSVSDNDWNINANGTGLEAAPAGNNVASGNHSIAAGLGNTASGDNSTVSGGNGNIASGNASTVFGTGNIASGENATAFGSGNTASGDYSVVWGVERIGSAGATNNFATGHGSTAWGENDTASGVHSTAFGRHNNASGSYSLALGTFNQAIGSASFVAGDKNKAVGSESFVTGSDNEAVGSQSFVTGTNNEGNSYSQVVLGHYSTNTIPTGSSATSVVPENIILKIGNGTSTTTRSNAMVVKANGNVGIGTSTPTSNLHTTGAISKPIVTEVSSNITLTDSHSTIITSATTASFTVTFPTPSTCIGRQYTIVNRSATNIKTIPDFLGISPGGSIPTRIPSATSMTFQSDGVSWYQIH